MSEVENILANDAAWWMFEHEEEQDDEEIWFDGLEED